MPNQKSPHSSEFVTGSVRRAYCGRSRFLLLFPRHSFSILFRLGYRLGRHLVQAVRLFETTVAVLHQLPVRLPEFVAPDDILDPQVDCLSATTQSTNYTSILGM